MNKLKKIQLMVKDFGVLFTVKYYFLKETKQYDKYIGMVYNYLTEYLKDYIIKFNNVQNGKNIVNGKNRNIWVCWWQGEQSMPNFCKMCYDNLKKNTPSEYKIYLITRENYKQYTDIPEYIVNKMEQGLITITQFSDILRQNLLLLNGGLWLDASIWVTPNYISKIDTTLPFWSIKLKKIDDSNVWGQLISKCKWGGFILYGVPDDVVFKFVYGAMCKYYYEHDSTIDYFIQNMLIRIAYDNVPVIQTRIDEIQVSNENLYKLYREMDAPYEEKKWNYYCEDTGIFKLTQKREYNEYSGGKLTFYGYLKSLSAVK